MFKEGTLHLILTVMFILLGLLVPLVPSSYAEYATLFCPALFVTVLSGVLLSFGEAMIIGALIPLGCFFLYREAALTPDTLVLALTYGMTGLVTGIIYRIFHTAFGAALSGLLAGRIALAVSSVILYYRMGDTYTFSMFAREALLSLWPCILLCIVFLPLLTALLRRQGVLQVLRHTETRR